MKAENRLLSGERFPFDATDAWWASDGSVPSPSVDWAHAAARGVLADLTDRRGIKRGFHGIDEDVRKGIVESLAEIIRVAKREAE